MSDVTTLIEQHGSGEPSWLHRDEEGLVAGDASRCSPEIAARMLAALDPVDRRLFVLSHGLGFGVGASSYATRVDPSLVRWHLERSLDAAAEEHGVRAADLEVAVRALLTDPSLAATQPTPDDASDWRPDSLLAAFPDDERDRLTARVLHNIDSHTLEEQRPGLGLGPILFVGLVVAAFMIYGALRDVNPVWHGTRLMALGQYAEARAVLSDYARMTNSIEAQTKIALCWLAEGQFTEAMDQFDEQAQRLEAIDPDANHPLGAFRPTDEPLVPLGGVPECAALLPRGLITMTRPYFVYEGSAPGTLELTLIPKVGTTAPPRVATYEVPEPEDDEERFRLVRYPSDWSPVPAGAATWSAPGDESEATFTVLDPNRTRKLMNRARLGLPPSAPEPAQYFLRGHFYLRHELYQQAGEQFAWLVKQFPEQPYPRELLDEIATALGVDRKVFLR